MSADFDYRAKAADIFDQHLSGLRPEDGISSLGYALAMVLHYCPPPAADFETTMMAIVHGIGQSLQDLSERAEPVATEH